MLRKFFTNHQGKVVVAQKPNLPIIIWAATALLVFVLPDGAWSHGLAVVSRTALVAWAMMEIGWGASYFRRLLGMVVLIWSIGSIFW